MKKYKNIMVIMNPQSGKSDSKDFEESIKEELLEYFEKVEIKYTKEEGHATELAKEACDEGYDSICSVGGDGTLAEVLSGMINSSNTPKLLIFPGGTGNIMSKSIGIEQDKEKVLKNIDFTRTNFINVGITGEKVFSFILSIGSIPDSLNEVSNEEKEKFGAFAYLSNLVKNINVENNYEIEVEVDDNKYSGVVDHLFVLSSKKYGYFEIPNVEEKDEDKFHVFILKDKGLWEKAKAGIDLITGSIESSESVEYYVGKNIKIKSLKNDDIPTDLDGDRGPSLPLELKMISDKIKVYLPKK